MIFTVFRHQFRISVLICRALEGTFTVIVKSLRTFVTSSTDLATMTLKRTRGRSWTQIGKSSMPALPRHSRAHMFSQDFRLMLDMCTLFQNCKQTFAKFLQQRRRPLLGPLPCSEDLLNRSNQLEKLLEAARSAYLWLPLFIFGYFQLPLVTFHYLSWPYLAFLGLTGPYWPYRALLGLTVPYCALLGLTGPYWGLLGLSGPYWALLGLTRMPCQALLGLIRPYWALLGLTRPYWAILGLTRPFFAFV